MSAQTESKNLAQTALVHNTSVNIVQQCLSSDDDFINDIALAKNKKRQDQLRYAEKLVKTAWKIKGKKFTPEQIITTGKLYELTRAEINYYDPHMDWGEDDDLPIHWGAGKLLDCASELLECIVYNSPDINEAFVAALLQWKLGAESGNLRRNPVAIVNLAAGTMAKFILRGLELCPCSEFSYLLSAGEREYSEKLRQQAERVNYLKNIAGL